MNERVARDVAVMLRDRGRPARSREIHARFYAATTYPLTEKASHALVAAALAGSRIVMTGAEWWFEGEAKPRAAEGDTFEDLLLAAAKEILREAKGREMSAGEIEAVLGDARLAVRKGWLADTLRRDAARVGAAWSGQARAKKPGSGKRNTKKGIAAAATIPDEGWIEKVGELYRWTGARQRH